MKGERRHELEQNQLADWLAKNIEAVKPYQNWILGVLLLLAVAGGWYSMSSGRTSARESESWDQFYKAMSSGEFSPGDFEDIAGKYEDTPLALWAAVMAGDLRLAQGCSDLFSDKPRANQELRDAVENYRKVLDQGGNSILSQRATFGLARALEAQGHLVKAILQYNKVADGAYAAAAASRAEDLQSESTKEFYDQFAQFVPRPYSPDEPGTPDQPPLFDLDSLSDDPVFGPGILDQDGKDNQDEPLPDAPETSTEPDAAETSTEPDMTDTDATDSDATDTNASDPQPDDPDRSAETPSTTE